MTNFVIKTQIDMSRNLSTDVCTDRFYDIFLISLRQALMGGMGCIELGSAIICWLITVLDLAALEIGRR